MGDIYDALKSNWDPILGMDEYTEEMETIDKNFEETYK